METGQLELCMVRAKQKHQVRAGKAQSREHKASFPGGIGEGFSEEATFQLAAFYQSNSVPIQSM